MTMCDSNCDSLFPTYLCNKIILPNNSHIDCSDAQFCSDFENACINMNYIACISIIAYARNADAYQTIFTDIAGNTYESDKLCAKTFCTWVCSEERKSCIRLLPA